MVEQFQGQANRDAHALAIGKIVMAWNEYQELLAEIFASFFSQGHWGVSLVAWHALNSDRAQREMLRAVALAKLPPDQPETKELKWLLDQTDQMISDQRNTGTHAPLMSFSDEQGTHRSCLSQCSVTRMRGNWPGEIYSRSMSCTRLRYER